MLGSKIRILSTVAIAALLIQSQLAAQENPQIGPHWAAVKAAVVDKYSPEETFHVPFGESMPFPEGDFPLILIEGACHMDRVADIQSRFEALVVAPGGILNAGTPADPVKGNVDLVIADTPLDTGDPAQWGHSILIFGYASFCGVAKQPWVESSSPLSGASVPLGAGWQPGDLILSPDTAAGDLRAWATDGEHFLTEGGTLDPPLGFEREAQEHVGAIVANFSRNIQVRSENPAGTRGHFLVTDFAEFQAWHMSLHGLGRTRPEPLSETNLIGRYGGIHFHHHQGLPQPQKFFGDSEAQFLVDDCPVDGVDYQSKWGHVIHQSHWGVVRNSAVARMGGAGIVTEDGNEIGNQITGNLVFDVRGVRQFSINIKEGFAGAGLWMKGIANFINNNTALNCEDGMQTTIIDFSAHTDTNPAQVGNLAQESPGGPRTIKITKWATTLSCDSNRFVCNRSDGYEGWQSHKAYYTPGNEEYVGWPSPRSTIKSYLPYSLPIAFSNCVFAYNGHSGASSSFTGVDTLFTNCKLVDNNLGGTARHLAYGHKLYMDGCDITGNRDGIYVCHETILSDCFFANERHNIWAGEVETTGFVWGFSYLPEHGVNNTFVGPTINFVPNDFYQENYPHVNEDGTTRGHVVEDIPAAWNTLADVYARVDEFRESFGVDPTDPTETRRQEILERLAQIAEQRATLAEQDELLAAEQEALEQELSGL